MISAVDRVNRIVLAVLGGLLILLGIAGLLHSFGAFGGARAASPIVSSPTVAWYTANGSWAWPVIALVALLLLVACIYWVSAQIRTSATSRIELQREDLGALTVSGHHLESSIEQDCANQVGIERARAKVHTDSETILLDLSVWVEAPYDVAAAVSRVTSTVLPHLSLTLDQNDPRPLRTRITIEAADAALSRLL